MARWILLGMLAASAAQAQTRSRAVGAPNDGRLEHGVALEASAHLVLQPSRELRVHATAELARMLTEAAARVAEQSPGSRLMVGTLSRRDGGRLDGHSSHQNGRDADVGLYMLVDGRSAEAPRFIELDNEGCGVERGLRYCLDALRTLRLLIALVESDVAQVQMILLAADLRARVLEAGRRASADAGALERLAALSEPRAGSEGHRNHFHVRIRCPEDDRPECIDDTQGSRRAVRPARRAARRRAHHRPRRRRR